MQYTAHKGLNAYIREQIGPKIILPAVLAIFVSIILAFFPITQNHTPVADTLSDAILLAADGSDNVTVHVNTLYYTGQDLSSGNHVCARIYYTFEKETCYLFVITLTKGNAKEDVLYDQTVTVDFCYESDLLSSISSGMAESLSFSPDYLNEILCPIILNQYEYTNGFIIFAAYGLHILLVLCLAGVIFILLILIRPSLSPCIHRLHRYGNSGALYAIAVAEFDTAIPTGRRNFYVTDTFFFALLPDEIIILPLDHITWVYQTHEVHHAKGRAKMFHSLCIVSDTKKIYRLKRLTESCIAALINAIASDHPSITIGNSFNRENDNNKGL